MALVPGPSSRDGARRVVGAERPLGQVLAAGQRHTSHTPPDEWPSVKYFQSMLKKCVFSKTGFGWLWYKHSHKTKGRSANHKQRPGQRLVCGQEEVFQGRSPGPPEGPNLV